MKRFLASFVIAATLLFGGLSQNTLGQTVSSKNLKGSAATSAPVHLTLPLKDGSVRFAVIGDTGTGSKKQQEVADVMPGAKRNNIRYLMWAMLGDGQLLKDSKGRYSPTNPTNRPTNRTNTPKGDTYAESEAPVSAVSDVSGDSEELPLSADLEPGESATLEELKRSRELAEEGRPSVDQPLLDDEEEL